MRILTQVYTLERVGGIEIYTLEVGRELAARGHDVHLVHGPALLGPEAPTMRPDLEAAGITLHGPHPFRSPTPVTALSAVRDALPSAALAARLRPDVLWLQRFEHVLWGQVVARRSGTPLVSHLHHALRGGPLVTLAARGVRRFIAVSEFMRQRWVDDGLPAGRIDVLHNAVPAAQYPVGGVPERDRARQALGLPADVPIALFYGRLEQDKGLRLALDAWDRTAGRRGAAHLVLAGEFPPTADPALAPRVADLVRTGQATLLPLQRDVVPLLHAADVVLFPSQLPESFGRVALEGLITGRPVLATAVGGVPEILSGPLTELLVPQTDVATFAERLVALLGWRERDPGLGARCAAHAATHFSFPDHVDRLEELLDRERRPRRDRSALPG
ncbi:glycosyltransferase family 4 protein [Modestobacter roseus]|uniref:glycosyltransferase family 4 protein n=1 Tax=Modestobacter roseus TaxID=1181884 RepID=UPI0034DF8019